MKQRIVIVLVMLGVMSGCTFQGRARVGVTSVKATRTPWAKYVATATVAPVEIQVQKVVEPSPPMSSEDNGGALWIVGILMLLSYLVGFVTGPMITSVFNGVTLKRR